MKRSLGWGGIRPFLLPLAGLSLLSISLYVIQSFRNGSGSDWYLLWNLFLAWLPVLFAAGWTQVVRTRAWSDWRSVLLSGLWFIFLPNSFYLVTDFIHLDDPHHTDMVTAAVMFTGFALTGLILGLVSLGTVHRELLRRLSSRMAGGVVAGILLLSSFAIYLGRDLRWNSWDIIFNPAGILFDVSDRIVDPGSHPQSVAITAVFFVLSGGLYLAAVGFAAAVRKLPKK